FRGQTFTALLAWLRRMLRNNCLSFVRAYRERGKRQISREVPLAGGGEPEGTELLPADDPSPSSDAGRREDAETLREAIAVAAPLPRGRPVSPLRGADLRGGRPADGLFRGSGAQDLVARPAPPCRGWWRRSGEVKAGTAGGRWIRKKKKMRVRLCPL